MSTPSAGFGIATPVHPVRPQPGLRCPGSREARWLTAAFVVVGSGLGDRSGEWPPKQENVYQGDGKQLDRRLRVAVNRAKALWPQAADQDLGGLAWIRAVCAPLCESTPLLSLNRFCLANQVNAVCFCRSSILLFRMAPNSARNRTSARTAGGCVGSSPP